MGREEKYNLKYKTLCRGSRHGFSKQLTWASQLNHLNLSIFLFKMGMGKLH